jgi:hypothetical protein
MVVGEGPFVNMMRPGPNQAPRFLLQMYDVPEPTIAALDDRGERVCVFAFEEQKDLGALREDAIGVLFIPAQGGSEAQPWVTHATKT